MKSLDAENPWVFVALSVAIWLAISSVFELVLFDGRLTDAVVPAVAGGIASGVVLFYYRSNVDG